MLCLVIENIAEGGHNYGDCHLAPVALVLLRVAAKGLPRRIAWRSAYDAGSAHLPSFRRPVGHSTRRR